MKDRYPNFEDLNNEESSKSFIIIRKERKSSFLIFTPHGGGIEPGTSEICRYCAKGSFSHYLFVGKGNKCKRLHITSTNFDEPLLLKTIAKHKYAISIHGMTNKIKKKYSCDVFLGGLNRKLIKITTNTLNNSKFDTVNNIKLPNSKLSGKDLNNVTNKCSSREGMQIEISEDLRAKFFTGNFKKRNGREKTTKHFGKFCNAIISSISKFENKYLTPKF